MVAWVARAVLLGWVLLASTAGCQCGAPAPGAAAEAPAETPNGERPGATSGRSAEDAPGQGPAAAPAMATATAAGPPPGDEAWSLAASSPDPAGERIVLGGVAVRTVDPEVPREIYPRQIAQRLGLQLAASGLFATRAAEVPAGLRARPATLDLLIRYDVLDQGSTGGPAVVAAVEGRIAWDTASRAPAPAEHVFAERPMGEGEDVDGLVAVHVADTVEQTGRGLMAKERLRTGGEAALAAVLGDAGASADMVAWALRLAAERRSPSLFEAVAGRLAVEDPIVRDHAVDALVAMDDPRAVDRLARQARFDDHAFLGKVIEAVVALGGDDARAYLEFLASGHPEQEIRARAAEGLARLRP